jgi:hypothetical protein
MDGRAGAGSRDARSVSALRAVFEAGNRAEDASGRQELPAASPRAPAPTPPVLLVRKPDAAAARKQGPVRGLTSTSGAPTPMAQWEADGGGSGAVEHGDAAGAAAEPINEWPLLNTEGNAVGLGRHPDFKTLYYCGQERPIPGSDGFCGNASVPARMRVACFLCGGTLLATLPAIVTPVALIQGWRSSNSSRTLHRRRCP